MYEDKTLVCKDCGNEFVFTAGEQEFYAERGFENEPKSCKPCRDAKKASRRANRVEVTITCDRCGAEDVVPFTPTEGKPVYCKKCYDELKESSAE